MRDATVNRQPIPITVMSGDTMSNDLPIDEFDPDATPPEVELPVLTFLAKRIKARTEELRELVGERYGSGNKRDFECPVFGEKLGSVSRNKSASQWRIVDAETLRGHLALNPSCVETVVTISGAEDEVLAALAEHAPHLLREELQVSQDALDDAVLRASEGEDVPGVEFVTKPGALVVRTNAMAENSVDILLAEGRVSLDAIVPTLMTEPPATETSAAAIFAA